METFVQPKITGYRQLTQEEAALMNEGKALADYSDTDLIDELYRRRRSTYDPD